MTKKFHVAHKKPRRSVEVGETTAPYVAQIMRTVPPELRVSYEQFSHEIVTARQMAERDAYLLGDDVSEHLDFSRAAAVLNNEPKLVDFLRRRYPNVPKRTLDDLVEVGKKGPPANSREGMNGAPSGGNVSRGMFGGTWAGSRNYPQGVPNARVYREWADNNVWVRSAINERRNEVSKADVIVMPRDDSRSWNRGVMRSVDLLLEQPNELKDSWRTLMDATIEDILVLDRGVWEKNLTRRSLPVGMYSQDGAAVYIYPAWTGDPKEPRYQYREPGTNRTVDLLNDQAIVMSANPATYRFGLSPVQVLRDTVRADIDTNRAAANTVGMKVPPHLVHIAGASKLQVEFIRDLYEADIAGRRELFFIGGDDVKVFPMTGNARDNQFLEYLEYLAQKIAICFQMSPQRFGYTMQINKATGEVQQQIDENRGLISLLLLLEEYLNRELLADFAPRLPMNRTDFRALNLKILFPQVSEIERVMHFETVLAVTAKAMPGLPVMTLNQALDALGEQRVLGGNSFWVMTTQGPVMWLPGYDNDLDAINELMGEQEPEGGPGSPSDGESDDDGTGNQPDESLNNPAESGDAGGPGGGVGGEGAVTAPDVADSALERAYLPDGRSPGRRWSPSVALLASRGRSLELVKPTTYAEAARKFAAASDKRRRRPPIRLVKEGQDGGMVALFLPRGLAESIALPDGEPASDLHVTLAYLPDVASLSADDRTRLSSVVKFSADRSPPLVGELGGYGRFRGEEKDPVFMTVDVPGLTEVYERLRVMLRGAGFKVGEEHGFTPHVTLKYVGPDEPSPVEGSPEPRTVIFDAISIALGDDREHHPILSMREALPASRFPGRIEEAYFYSPLPEAEAGSA